MKKLAPLFIFLAPALLLAVPKAPSNLKLKALSGHSVSISWRDNSDDESGFKIFRDSKLIAVTKQNAQSYIDEGLKPNTTYTYTVKATDDASPYTIASNFLSRATFGATKEDIDSLASNSDYEKWIEDQFKIAPSYHMDWALSHAKGVDGVSDLSNAPQDWENFSDALGVLERDAWWDIAVNGKDQLRQRVAFALSEILVISRNGPLVTYPDARMSYYDVLVKDAFSNFEQLLRDVTYHPAMGKYLSYLGNAKENPQTKSHPDENYAREVMQLFTIGLYELNLDGSKKLKNSKPIPTYTQKDIRQMAKVFTGLSDDNGNFSPDAAFDTHYCRTHPMVPFEMEHDRSQKSILHSKKIIPSGGDTKTDINKALHILFMHQNTAPFISKQLIQRLVTSNPSPAYIKRVASVFEDNGKGVRGDLKAVIKAILLDDEALYGDKNFPDRFGKFREPLLYVTHLFRAFHAKNGVHTLYLEDKALYRYRSFNFNGTGMTKQEGALEALTVFNYFTPDDGPSDLKKQNLVAPELELYGKQGIDDVLMGLITENEFVYKLFDISAKLQLDNYTKLIKEKRYKEMLDELDLLLTGKHLSKQTKDAILKYMKDHSNIGDEKLVRLTIGLVITSPDYALQR